MLLVTLAGLFLLLLWLGLTVSRLYTLARSLQARQAQATALLAGGLGEMNPDELEQWVLGLRQDVAALSAETRPFLWATPYLGWVPKVGPLLLDAEPLLDLADAGTLAAASAVTGLKPALVILQQPRQADQSRLPQMLEVIQNARPALQATTQAFERAAEARQELAHAADYPGRVQQALALFDRYAPLAGPGLQLVPLLPDLSGMNGAQTYLILAQNEDELRATGGFISGVGLLTAANGEIQALDFQDASFVADYLHKPYSLPPQPMVDFMGLELFLFRDANYWPDFRISAEKAIELYRYSLDNVPPIDGVIAINQRFLQTLLGAIGAVELPGIETPVTQQNVVRFMRASWGTDEGEKVTRDWMLERKAFMSELAKAIQAKILRDPGSLDWLKLAETLFRSGAARDLQLYLTDPARQAVIGQVGWDGRLVNATGQDFLLPLDMNMGYNKVNAVMQRAVAYDVALAADNSAEATLELTYTHTGPDTGQPCVHAIPYRGNLQYQDLIDSCYWNYVRVYTPTNSRLVDATSHPAPADWFVTGRAWNGSAQSVSDPSGLTVFDNFMVTPRNQTLISRYHYRLPAGVIVTEPDNAYLYQLTLFKQGGEPAQAYHIQITLPDGRQVIHTTPPDAIVIGPTIQFNLTLEHDVTLAVRYR